MAPKKNARTGQRANVTPGVAVDHIIDDAEAVELASYRLKELAYSWFELWEESHEEESPPAKWSKFTDAFIDHFLPAETKAARAAEFESLRQGSVSVWEYHVKFTLLSKYAIYMLPTMEARVRRFVQGLSPLVINEAAMAALNSDMNYGKWWRLLKVLHMRVSSRPAQSIAQSSARALPSGRDQQRWGHSNQGKHGSNQ
ncbi:uncharacterized protein [Nicotiana tomentosiformis]|uniref:uncharacterized protein n=1 Tax=Nicotiana tomentosiformis TaxID=4098 RepID=UPI00388C38F5